MIPNGTYHKAIFLPKIKYPNREIELTPSRHALEQAGKDRYGLIRIPARINFNNVDIIEVEIQAGKVFKVVIRMPYNNTCDLVMPILINGAIIKTVWLNRKNDKHETLDHTKYIQKP